LEADPGSTSARVLLARVALGGGEAPGALDEAEGLLGPLVVEGSSARVQASAWHLLGNVSERREAWDEAFERHMCGNRAFERLPETRAARTGGGRIDRAAAYLGAGGAALYRAWAEAEPVDDRADPAFLVGFPRSGTTMTEQVLAAHPDVLTTDEQNYTEVIYHAACAMIGPGPDGTFLERLDALTPDQLRALRRTYYQSVERDHPEASPRRVLVDKNPMEILDVGLIARVFPRARIIVMVRDPRDACLSALFQAFEINASTVRMLDIEETGAFYARVMRFWMEMRERLATPWMELRYEDLVSDFESRARALYGFVGLDWREEALRFHEKAAARAVHSASYGAVTRAVNSSSVARWRRYEAHLRPLREHVEPLARAFGYEAW
jgi:hypothetical protein